MNTNRILMAATVLLVGGMVYANAEHDHDAMVTLCSHAGMLGRNPGHEPFLARDVHELMRPPGLMPTDAPAFLHGLDLTDEQQDQIFEILHAQAPAMYQQQKALRMSRAQIHALASRDSFDIGQVQSAADIAARAIASSMVLRAETESKIRALLTPGQRQQVSARQPDTSPPLPPE